MTFRNIFEGLGEFFSATFKILEPLGWPVNILFMLIGVAFFIYWMGQMIKFEKNGEK